MTLRNAHRAGSSPADPDRTLLAALAALLARTAAARHTSRTLTDRAASAAARTEAIQQRGLLERARWRAWRAGVASARAGVRTAGEPWLFRVCLVCDGVCFTVAPSPDRGTADPVPHDVWIEPPESLRERFRNGLPAALRGARWSHGLCESCLPTASPEHLDGQGSSLEALPNGLPREAGCGERAARHTAGILRVLAQIDEVAARIAARKPWLDEAEALERALALAVRALSRDLPDWRLRSLVGDIHALIRALGGEPPPRRAAGPRKTSRFRPPLRPQ